MPKVIDYVRNKKELRDLMKASKNWERKIAIAKTARKRLIGVMNEGQKMKENEYAWLSQILSSYRDRVVE